MTRILAFVEYYLPGYTAGGPIRTISNLVDQLGEAFDFRLVTSHEDSRDPESYAGVVRDQFQQVGKGKVFYASPSAQALMSMRRLICETPHDVLYLNSVWSPNFTVKPLLLRRLGLLPHRPVVVASRGEFSKNALAIKATKKRHYLNIARWLGLYDGVVWQASSEYEAEDIRRHLGSQSRVVVAPNLPRAVPDEAPTSRKKRGHLRMVHVARVARMKNLDGGLRMLQTLALQPGDRVSFDIYGPIEDEALWMRCQEHIAELPSHIDVQYRGALRHEEVRGIMSGYDLFFLPTLGENFGHSIAEALSEGLPVLISDRTPWRGLAARQAGWDVGLDDASGFQNAMQACLRMGRTEHQKWATGARNYAREVIADPMKVELNRRLFASLAEARLDRTPCPVRD